MGSQRVGPGTGPITTMGMTTTITTRIMTTTPGIIMRPATTLTGMWANCSR